MANTNERKPLLGSTVFRPTENPQSLEIINPVDGAKIGNLLWNDNEQITVEIGKPDSTVTLPLSVIADIANMGNQVRSKIWDRTVIKPKPEQSVPPHSQDLNF